LGLYICRQIADAHAGRIWADSPGENQGAIMHLWLPVPITLADNARFTSEAA
jgi:signal transduction histidine kinase